METEVNPVFGGMVALGVMVLVAGAFATCCGRVSLDTIGRVCYAT